MKNIFKYILILLLLPVSVFGQVNYSRIPNDFVIHNPVSFNVDFIYDDVVVLCGDDFDYWSLKYTKIGEDINSDNISSETLDHTFNEILPYGEYNEVAFVCRDENSQDFADFKIEYNNNNTIFKVVSSQIFTIEEADIEQGLSYVDDIFSDYMPFTILTIGIFFAFMVIENLIEKTRIKDEKRWNKLIK